MGKSNESIMRIIINIMGIQKEPEYIENLHEWINEVGVDVVFMKVIKMYSLSLS